MSMAQVKPVSMSFDGETYFTQEYVDRLAKKHGEGEASILYREMLIENMGKHIAEQDVQLSTAIEQLRAMKEDHERLRAQYVELRGQVSATDEEKKAARLAKRREKRQAKKAAAASID